METVKSILSDVIKGFVKYPEDVELFDSVDTDEKGELNIINVKVNRADIGICIGTEGNTAESLRKIAGLIGFKHTGKRIYVKIDAPKIPKDHFDYEKKN